MGCLSCVQSLSYDLNFVTACAVYNIVYFGPRGECFPTLSAWSFVSYIIAAVLMLIDS